MQLRFRSVMSLAIGQASIRLIVVCLFTCLLPAPTLATTEYGLKAAVLYRILYFVEWPAEAQRPTIQICTYGDTPIAQSLIAITNRTIGGRTLRIRSTNDAHALSACDVVFIASSQTGDVHPVTAQLTGHAQLSISDMKDFCCVGGMVGMYLDNERIRLTIDRRRTETAGVRISAKLLELALPAVCGEPP